MQLLAKCPRCGQVLHLELSDADKRKRCPKCSRLFKVPDAKHLQQALRVIESANATIYVDQDGNTYG